MMVKKEIAGKEFTPTPTLKLTEKVGNYVKGTLKKVFNSKMYPNKKSFLIIVDDLEGRTTLWNKETKQETEADVEVGNEVFVQGTTVLQQLLSDVNEGTLVEITYTGKGEARRGQKPPYLFLVKAEEN